jgi:EAL domain-containing protein (putative c-di-GMP-specific phosphodiesterase class I)/GGDEF domain-containing protein
MSHIPLEVAEDAQFHIQLRQAVLAAQYSSRHIGVLLIEFGARHPCSGGSGRMRDDAIESAVAVVANTLRESDAICRRPGGETAVLLSSLRNPEDAMLVAEKILHNLDQLLQRDNDTIGFRPKIGVSVFPNHGTNPATLLECAYIALETARKDTSRCVLYTAEISRSHRPPLRRSMLRQAIIRDQLFPLYQPKIDLKNERITGLEVLTRWRHPEHGLILPDEFIPLAERTGLIVPLTLWVLNAALNQCRRWHEHGIDVNLAINLSMWNLDALELPDQIAALLSSTGVSPDQLELEITESALIDDPQHAMRTVKAIRELGVRFTIDDFGTGYSSLAYLKKLPVSGIKIDKSFTLSMERDNDCAVIVRAIIDLGHNLGLKVIAEGVETSETMEMLAEYGCDEAQGYYFSRPVAAADIASFLRDRLVSTTNHGGVEAVPSKWPVKDSRNFSPAFKPSF